ncbi:MAG: hypothetical protein HRF40_06850 [Nitrososphaera sp.]
MSKNVGKNDSNELTEKEKKILAYRLEGHTYRETCKDLRVSAAEISIAEKKERGEYEPEKEEKSSSNFDNYTELYRLFSTGKQPIQTAMALNLPVDFVGEQYIEFLKSKRLHSLVQLYQRVGDGGIKSILLAYSSMVQSGYSKDPRSVGPYIKYCEGVRVEDMKLEEVRKSSRRAQDQIMAARNQIHEIEQQKDAALKEMDSIKKQIGTAKRELVKIGDLIAYQTMTNPAATAAEAARQMAEAVLNNHPRLIRMAQDVIYYSAKNNPYTRWMLLPQTRPPEFSSLPNAEIERRLDKAIYDVAVDYYDRLTCHIVSRTFENRNFMMC